MAHKSNLVLSRIFLVFVSSVGLLFACNKGPDGKCDGSCGVVGESFLEVPPFSSALRFGASDEAGLSALLVLKQQAYKDSFSDQDASSVSTMDGFHSDRSEGEGVYACLTLKGKPSPVLKPATVVTRRAVDDGLGLSEGGGGVLSPLPEGDDAVSVVSGSPFPLARKKKAEPRVFKDLKDGKFSPTVLFDYDGLFAFVGLMSNTYQASVSPTTEWGFESSLSAPDAAREVQACMTEGTAAAQTAVKFALQVTCALNPHDIVNRKVEWKQLPPEIKQKGEFLFEVLNFIAVKLGVLNPDQDAYASRTWHNAGAPFQTVPWPHLNWAVNDSVLSYGDMKLALKNPRFKQLAENFYAYLNARLGSSELYRCAEVVDLLNDNWPLFKTECPDLFE